MIGRLVGTIVDDSEGGVLIVDVVGVGYEVSAPLGTRGRAGADANGATTLHIHTHVREDVFTLFGFASPSEREAFRIIIGVSNVGPKLGLSILSALTVDELAMCVARGDTGKLQSIPGVGKKTAERLVLELKGKIAVVPGTKTQGTQAPVGPRPTSSQAELLLGALTRMGYRPAEAERAVATVSAGKPLDDIPLSELVREALGALSK